MDTSEAFFPERLSILRLDIGIATVLNVIYMHPTFRTGIVTVRKGSFVQGNKVSGFPTKMIHLIGKKLFQRSSFKYVTAFARIYVVFHKVILPFVWQGWLITGKQLYRIWYAPEISSQVAKMAKSIMKQRTLKI
jgi:hypothetical protein